MSNLLTAREVRQKLRIGDKNVVRYLVARGLLPQIELGPKTFRYKEEHVERLIERSANEGLHLTLRP